MACIISHAVELSPNAFLPTETITRHYKQGVAATLSGADQPKTGHTSCVPDSLVPEWGEWRTTY